MARLQPVVDALAVEWIDATCRVADEHPVGTADATHGAAHGQEGRPRRSHVVLEFPVLALRSGGVVQERAQVDVRRSLRGCEGSDSDVHLPVAQREDPAVARQDPIIVVAQLEMGRDPLVVAAARLDVAAGSHAVRRVAVPFASEGAAQLRARPVGNDEPAALDLSKAVAGLDGDRDDPVAIASHIDSTSALD